jgi:DNA replication protein DnaC
MNYESIDYSDIEKKYRNLERFIEQMAQGKVRSLIVNGPPGVGKTYSATTYIEKYSTQKHKSITGQVILPFCKGVRSRNVMQPWQVSASV